MTPPSISCEKLMRAKLRLLEMHYHAGVGHIGGNLSALDILLALYHGVIGADDAFILSKGHAAGALYVALWSRGHLSDTDLEMFHKDGTLLSAHPPATGLKDVLFATGSLGHGLPLCCGLALSRKLRAGSGQVFCLTSDGEWNEGSNWEALIFARQQRLENLTVIVDCNGLQGFGPTDEVADLAPLGRKFTDFGWHVVEVDGHDPAAVAAAAGIRSEGPRAIIAATVKGKGVSFMENRFEWHYLPLTADLYEQAIMEVTATCDGK